LGCFAICDVKNALHTLCNFMYHYDCFYICKDLTEGEINKSINQSFLTPALISAVGI